MYIQSSTTVKSKYIVHTTPITTGGGYGVHGRGLWFMVYRIKAGAYRGTKTKTKMTLVFVFVILGHSPLAVQPKPKVFVHMYSIVKKYRRCMSLVNVILLSITFKSDAL
jgi:hypothetical protein